MLTLIFKMSVFASTSVKLCRNPKNVYRDKHFDDKSFAVNKVKTKQKQQQKKPIFHLTVGLASCLL